MNATTLMLYLALSEAVVVAIVSAILIIRNKKKKAAALKQAQDKQEKKSPPNLKSHLQSIVKQTRTRVKTLPDDEDNKRETQLLNTRIQFLESEISTLADLPDETNYWTCISERLDALVPLIEEAEIQIEELEALDDLSPEEEKEKGSITIDTSKQEMSRLRNIISRQHATMDELKQTILAQNLSAEESEKVASKLEEVDVAHAQLNMCIEVLEKENHRLIELAEKAQSDISLDEVTQMTKQELSQANERIESLVHEKDEQDHQITDLESEILSLKTVLQQNENELERIELQDADLSRIDNDDEDSNSDVLKGQIEQLTEMLMKKSDELQAIQGDSAEVNSTSILEQGDLDSIDIIDTDEIDDIPVLQPYSEPENTDLVLNSTETTSDGDITILADASEAEDLDESDIVMEDDMFGLSIDDEIDDMLAESSSDDDGDDIDFPDPPESHHAKTG